MHSIPISDYMCMENEDWRSVFNATLNYILKNRFATAGCVFNVHPSKRFVSKTNIWVETTEGIYCTYMKLD